MAVTDTQLVFESSVCEVLISILYQLSAFTLYSSLYYILHILISWCSLFFVSKYTDQLYINYLLSYLLQSSWHGFN